MVKPDSRYASKVQMVAQEQLRELLEASAHYDRVEDLARKLDAASLLVQETAAAKAAVKRCIEILTAANSDEECAEAVRLVGGILDTVEHTRPLQ
jgi:hypothetical protein